MLSETLRYQRFAKIRKILGCGHCPVYCHWANMRCFYEGDALKRIHPPPCEKKGAGFIEAKLIERLSGFERWLLSEEGNDTRDLILDTLENALAGRMSDYLNLQGVSVPTYNLHDMVRASFSFTLVPYSLRPEKEEEDD